MIKIFLGSKNKAKYPYYHKYCSLLNCKFSTPHDIKECPKFEETGKTIQENAEIKAINWSRYTPDIVLAEDCGVNISALKDWKSVLSKRNLGENVTDNEKRKKLLEIMKDLKGEDRRVIWTTAIALAKNGKLLGSISIDNPNLGYIVEKINPKARVVEGELFSCIEFKPKFGKVYSDLSEEEIEQNEKDMFNAFRKFIKEKVEG